MEIFAQDTAEQRARLANFGRVTPVTRQEFWSKLEYDWPDFWQVGGTLHSGEHEGADLVDDMGPDEVFMMAEPIGDGTRFYGFRIDGCHYSVTYTVWQPSEVLQLVRAYVDAWKGAE